MNTCAIKNTWKNRNDSVDCMCVNISPGCENIALIFPHMLFSQRRHIYLISEVCGKGCWKHCDARTGRCEAVRVLYNSCFQRRGKIVRIDQCIIEARVEKGLSIVCRGRKPLLKDMFFEVPGWHWRVDSYKRRRQMSLETIRRRMICYRDK